MSDGFLRSPSENHFQFRYLWDSSQKTIRILWLHDSQTLILLIVDLKKAFWRAFDARVQDWYFPLHSSRWSLFCGLQSLHGRMEKLESGIGNLECGMRNRNPETEPNQKNKWMIQVGKYGWHQYASSPLFAFLARWMMIHGALLRKGTSIYTRKGTSIKNLVVIILSFSV